MVVWMVITLGLVKVRFGVFNPLAPERVTEIEGVVDTGAVYSVVPRRTLEELGVKPLEKRRFKAFGGHVERDIGEVGVELMGRRRTVTVILGETGDTAVLGLTALEAFGLEVDPVKGILRETDFYSYKTFEQIASPMLFPGNEPTLQTGFSCTTRVTK